MVCIAAAQPRTDTCPSREAIDLVSGRWTTRVLHALARKPLRYNALFRRVDGVSQKMLTRTLRALERDGLVERSEEAGGARVRYALTDLGESLLDALGGLCRWAEEHMAEVEAARALEAQDAPDAP